MPIKDTAIGEGEVSLMIFILPVIQRHTALAKIRGLGLERQGFALALVSAAKYGEDRKAPPSRRQVSILV